MRAEGQTVFDVGRPPPRPLLVFDGGCRFCTCWAVWLRHGTGGAVDFAPFQAPWFSARFPEIPRRQAETAVQLVGPDGSVSGGSAAILAALRHVSGWRWLPRLAGRFGFVAWALERGYRFVARRRALFGKIVRCDTKRWGGTLAGPPASRGLGGGRPISH